MIYPQKNRFRMALESSGKWDFRKDTLSQGLWKGWHRGFKKEKTLRVPGSWNEQSPDLMNYLGPAWYQKKFSFHSTLKNHKFFIRFDSVNYHATVWLNNKKLGSHEGGHLPFEFEVARYLREGVNLLVVRVEGLLRPDRVPPGNVPPDPKDSFGNQFNPPVVYDFFPFCGIQRPVWLYTTPKESIEDVTVTTDIRGKSGIVRVQARANNTQLANIRVSLEGFGWKSALESSLRKGKSSDALVVPQARLWAPRSPHLYRLTVELRRDGKTLDQVRLPVGIRTIAVKGSRLLLNGKQVFLRGFGRHEDYPGFGRHLPPVVLRKDYRNMEWVGANSFRTTHYPYSDQDMDLADKKGFLVIDETPAVGLFFSKAGLKKRLALCRQFTREMIERDKNHPSVVMWSLANEPHSRKPTAVPFFKSLAALARSLDKTRPVTLVSFLGSTEESFRFLDAVCVNRYYGWYSEPGDLPKAIPRLSRDLDAIHRKFRKPVLVTEFGADAIPGSHANPPAMFSEEYQAEMLERYWKVIRDKPYVAGAHVWNLNDFKTAQATHRPNGMNYKGIFTRNRKPKRAAFQLRKLWGPTGER
ncbi:MAG TPA: glycoside hydrolase family 2 TIM barrel-domain containing protein [bacterium]|nr:glycoside hydrolase family 2 TIM barrel-domain containing protein [bacterium]